TEERSGRFRTVEALLHESIGRFRPPDLFHAPPPDIIDEATTTQDCLRDMLLRHDERHCFTIAANVVMLATGEGNRGPDADRLLRSFARYRAACNALPHSTVPITVARGDSRALPMQEEGFDRILTSPPYINVFNYHQNFRQTMELLGEAP